MKLNIELSKEFKKKYRHRIRQCYKNAYNLWLAEQMDAYVIGFITSKVETTGEEVLVRHGWCVKDKEIIDSTICHLKDVGKTEYYPCYTFNNRECFFNNILPNVSSAECDELDWLSNFYELRFLDVLKEKLNLGFAKYIKGYGMVVVPNTNLSKLKEEIHVN